MTEPRQAVRHVADLLRKAGIVSADAEARVLVAEVLGIRPGDLVMARPLSSIDDRHLAAMTQRRCLGEPLQHIIGQAWFRTVEVRVGPGVFIPRPETEVLAGWAIEQVRGGARRVVELCAGSGAIASSIMAEANPVNVWAVERNPQAYTYLVANLEGTGVTPVCADMAHALTELDGTVDLVVANPPYVPTSQIANLPPDVGHDPDEALFSGADGLDATRVVALRASRLLRGSGLVASEHGEDQAEAVREIFAAHGFVDVTTHADLTGRPRFCSARRMDGGTPAMSDPHPSSPHGMMGM